MEINDRCWPALLRRVVFVALATAVVGFQDMRFESCANLLPPSPSSLSIEDATRLTIAQYDLIVEGTIVGTFPDTVTISGQCISLGGLLLADIESLWGQVTDSTLKVHSWSLLPEADPNDQAPCLQNHLGQGSLPASQSRGTFLLVCGSRADIRSVAGPYPTLSSPRFDFLSADKSGFVTQWLMGHPYQWNYKEWTTELRNQSSQISLQKIAPAAKIIVSGTLGHFEELKVDEECVRYPFRLQSVYRGEVPKDPLFLAFLYVSPKLSTDGASTTQGVANRNISERRIKPLALGLVGDGRQVLVMADLLPNGNLKPLPYGCLPMNNSGFVLGPDYTVQRSTVGLRPTSLENLRAILK